jgi:hypothetical protein
MEQQEPSPELKEALYRYRGAWVEAILTHYCKHVATGTGQRPSEVFGEVEAIYKGLMGRLKETLPKSPHPLTKLDG